MFKSISLLNDHYKKRKSKTFLLLSDRRTYRERLEVKEAQNVTWPWKMIKA